jgi:hypothetical protein
MFPLKHGEALADEIPAARLLTLPGAGHGVSRADWNTIVAAIVEHTASKPNGDDGATSHPGRFTPNPKEKPTPLGRTWVQSWRPAKSTRTGYRGALLPNRKGE